jgi:hypothetical protein
VERYEWLRAAQGATLAVRIEPRHPILADEMSANAPPQVLRAGRDAGKPLTTARHLAELLGRGHESRSLTLSRATGARTSQA